MPTPSAIDKSVTERCNRRRSARRDARGASELDPPSAELTLDSSEDHPAEASTAAAPSMHTAATMHASTRSREVGPGLAAMASNVSLSYFNATASRLYLPVAVESVIRYPVYKSTPS